MTTFDSLVRLHTWQLNEKRQRLVGLEELVERMRADLAALEADLASEQRAAGASMEGTMAFPAFVAAALERRKRLRQTIAELEKAVDSAREEVRAAFEELKAYELARDKYARDERLRLSRREQADLDELGATMHRRRRSAGEE
ncbi:MAG: flagellar export protein FliJ [Alphaproteobacteria bacterium]|nr:MAG: flagellar export protein FliJ [Alphaproteobacteria bacterium]